MARWKGRRWDCTAERRGEEEEAAAVAGEGEAAKEAEEAAAAALLGEGVCILPPVCSSKLACTARL
jgi:hypothetical protein